MLRESGLLWQRVLLRGLLLLRSIGRYAGEHFLLLLLGVWVVLLRSLLSILLLLGLVWRVAWWAHVVRILVVLHFNKESCVNLQTLSYHYGLSYAPFFRIMIIKT